MMRSRTKMLTCWFIVIVMTGGVGGVYLYFPDLVTRAQAVSRCGQFGMTLLEIYSQRQLDTWNNITTALFSLHNFRWLDAGNVSFLGWYAGEPDGLPGQGCVRIKKGLFGTMYCTATYSAVCQPAVHLGLTVTQNVFRLVSNKTSATDTVVRFESSPFSPSYVSAPWLVRVNAPSDVIDPYDCVMHCVKSSGCAFVTYNRTSVTSVCAAFLQADLPAIH